MTAQSPPRTVVSWATVLCVVVGVAVLVALGGWQLSRAQTKTALRQQWQANRDQVPLDPQGVQAALREETVEVSALYGRAVALTGAWVPGSTLLLDNRLYQGRSGWVVLGLWQWAEGGPAVLVQRGWLPRDRWQPQSTPTVALPADARVLHGRVAPAPSQLWTLGGSPNPAGVVRPNVDLVALSAQWQRPLWPFSIQQTDVPAEPGWVLPWGGSDGQPNPDKNYGYALQWFGLAVVLAGGAGWAGYRQWRHPRREN